MIMREMDRRAGLPELPFRVVSSASGFARPATSGCEEREAE